MQKKFSGWIVFMIISILLILGSTYIFVSTTVSKPIDIPSCTKKDYTEQVANGYLDSQKYDVSIEDGRLKVNSEVGVQYFKDVQKASFWTGDEAMFFGVLLMGTTLFWIALMDLTRASEVKVAIGFVAIAFICFIACVKLTGAVESHRLDKPEVAIKIQEYIDEDYLTSLVIKRFYAYQDDSERIALPKEIFKDEVEEIDIAGQVYSLIDNTNGNYIYKK